MAKRKSETAVVPAQRLDLQFAQPGGLTRKILAGTTEAVAVFAVQYGGESGTSRAADAVATGIGTSPDVF